MTRIRPPGVFVGITVLLLVVPVPRASADPIAQKRAEAAAIATRLDAQAKQLTAAGREYIATQAKLTRTNDALVQAEVDLRAAEERRTASESHLVRRALTAYIRGGRVNFLEQLARGDGSELIARHQYLAAAAAADRRALEELRSAREDLTERRAHLRRLKGDVEAASRELAKSKASMVSTANSQRALLAKVNGELAGLVVAEQARRDAERMRRNVELGKRGVSARAGAMGDTWACIRMLESSNNYRSPGGGAYQFTDATWHGLGQTGTASDAPPEVQDAMAVELQRQSGWGPWTTAPLCGRS